MAWFTYISKRQCDFARVLFSRNFADAKFRENKYLAKISELYIIWIHTVETAAAYPVHQAIRKFN